METQDNLVIIGTENYGLYALLAAEVESAGYAAHWVADGLELLDAAERLSPKVLLLAENLPVLGAAECCMRMRQTPDIPRDLPVFFVTDNEVNPVLRDKAGFTGVFPATHASWELHDLLAALSVKK